MHGCELFDCSDIKGTNCFCDEAATEIILKRLRETGTAPGGIRFLGSGNYHYVSFLTTSLIQEPYTLVMIDHHPDLRTPAFGDVLSCGGWVREVLLKQPLCKQVVLIGVDEGLFKEECRDLPEECLEKITLTTDVICPDTPVFLSIDLDVLSEEEYLTNWDQGEMTREELLSIVRGIKRHHRIIGVDICGASH